MFVFILFWEPEMGSEWDKIEKEEEKECFDSCLYRKETITLQGFPSHKAFPLCTTELMIQASNDKKAE